MASKVILTFQTTNRISDISVLSTLFISYCSLAGMLFRCYFSQPADDSLDYSLEDKHSAYILETFVSKFETCKLRVTYLSYGPINS